MDRSTFTPANPSDGVAISSWSDKSGSNFTFTASTTATYTLSNNGLTFSTSSGGYTSSHPANVVNETMFTVFTPTTSASMYVIGGSTAGARGVGCYIDSLRYGIVNAGVAWGAITPSGDLRGTNTRNIGVSVVTSGSNTQVSANGRTLTGVANVPAYSAGTSQLSMEGATRTMVGIVHEVIAYTRVLSVTERQQVEGYLAWKWGLQNSLPTTHPYYRFRP